MINFNGNIQDTSNIAIENNRGFLYGDAIFETIKVNGTKILFLEEHYLRLMASMRICRMEIPMNFTMEFMEEEILKLIELQTNKISNRIRFAVYRNAEGFYNPTSNDVQFVVTCSNLTSEKYVFLPLNYEVELFKDFHVSKHLLSTLKTNNKMINVVASVFAKENGFDNCLLINDDKNVVEAINGNIFMKMGNQLITPPTSDGCLNGIMRKQIIALVSKMENIEIIEKSISPFDLQKADELFLSNVISGIQPITKYRKKEFTSELAKEITELLNNSIN
ncbi:aminotransferase class IV [Flavobacterium sp. F372]|uniref:branched-chain-amino-acid transaminase n=1 Tax=Flavobacterium bernardetii TaxID=2813823 RepID=A0ABR7IVY2_9FLAO|nr:aminotransferase class IV [Flavobacterium bernardetii]MBC5833920.1 aminotransferase class IV [Flavobacterium bernardetii]NHF69153.1 aminotransferase class IV [Flavobacterium bernardetii]